MSKIILDLCGGTGSWSKPYRDAGYDVRVITMPEYDVNSQETKEYCLSLNPYGILAAPPCTKFSRAAWQIKKKDRDFVEGMRCVRSCMDIIWSIQEKGLPLKFWSLENPDGYLTQFLGYPVYSFQPWQFGDESFLATKRTMLWGYFQNPVPSVNERNCPFVEAHTHNRIEKPRLFPVEKIENEEWTKRTQADRAKTSEHFAKAFFEANP